MMLLLVFNQLTKELLSINLDNRRHRDMVFPTLKQQRGHMEAKIDCGGGVGVMAGVCNERQRRIMYAALARNAPGIPVSRIARECGCSRQTVYAGLSELDAGLPEDVGGRGSVRVRAVGAGRMKALEKQPGLREAVDGLVSPHTRGIPESLLRWTTKSLRRLSRAQEQKGFRVSHVCVGSILQAMGYTLQSNKKAHERGDHPDRDAQFEHISETSGRFVAAGFPVISIDCKKKEIVGNYKNAGREYAPPGAPVEVEAHDFATLKANPFGVCDIQANEGWVNVGVDHDTAAFAANSLRQWWEHMGGGRYPGAKVLYVCADGGGSNGSRNRLWKTELQRLADDLDMNIAVSHFPPGTSKWNKIEHRMFSAISMDRRGRPLTSVGVIVNLVKGTTNNAGLKIGCGTDGGKYETGVKVSDEQKKKVNLIGHDFHPEWNYLIRPNVS
jgi:transposase-like protein